MSTQTPLKRARGLGSAKDGTGHFWQQRMTALTNVPLVLFFVWFILTHVGAARTEVIASLRNPFVAILLALTLASVTWHMRLGMQVIIEDYVHAPVRKVLLLWASTVFAALIFAFSAFSILKMSLGI
jgi:succinate dehydrogenase / fumarate reductase, membrane anchor subunit